MATATKSKEKTKTYRPMDDRVLILPTPSEEKTASGVFLPEGAKEKPMTGTIVATGPGKYADDGTRQPLTVKKGDKVVYGKYAGTEIEIGGTKHLIVKESELLAVVED